MESGERIVTVTGGLSFVSILQIIFIVLKLCGVINWHWLVVMLPLIFSVGVPVLALVLIFSIYSISRAIDAHNRKK